MAIALGQLQPCALEWTDDTPTPATDHTLVLLATGGSWTETSGRKGAYGSGQRAPFDSIPVDVGLKLTVDCFVNYDSELATAFGLINSADSTELTACSLTIGTVLVSGKMQGLTFKVDTENELSCSITVEGSSVAADAPSLPTTAALFSPNTIVFTGLGTSLNCSTFNLSVTNAIKGRRAMGADRLPAILAEGKQATAFDMTLLDAPTVPTSITADALAKVAAPTVAITDTSGSTWTLTFTFANALAIEQSATLNLEDILEHGIKYEAESVAFGVA